jgi:hypothetical protein
MFDEYVLAAKHYLKHEIAGVPIIDEATMFYTQRPRGQNYLVPFAYDNPNFCQGESSEIPDEPEFDVFIAKFPAFNSMKGEMWEDTLKFIEEDWSLYAIYGELVTDAQFKTADLRHQKMQKRHCVTKDPNTGANYEDYPYYELISFDTYAMNEKYRFEWRQLLESLGATMKEGKELSDIGTPEERIAAREKLIADYEAEKLAAAKE